MEGHAPGRRPENRGVPPTRPSFLVDLLKGEGAAVQKAKELYASGERLSIAAPALAEVLIEANFQGGGNLSRSLEILSAFEVLDVDASVAAEAGRIGAELLRRGEAVATLDLLIVAAAKVHQHVLITRDAAFSRIPGLAVEAY